MAYVVFLRAANVGGRNALRPARLAADLVHLDVVNVGAAGTFVVRGKATEAAIRREILARVSFEPTIVVRRASEILALVASDPFRGITFSRDLRGWAAALAGRPKARPDLPLLAPRGRDWSVRVDRVEDKFAVGLSRRRPGGSVFPSSVLEDALGVPATTSWWETVQRLASLLSPRTP
jgi:uncharacterized protein (DUF1697 family)